MHHNCGHHTTLKKTREQDCFPSFKTFAHDPHSTSPYFFCCFVFYVRYRLLCQFIYDPRVCALCDPSIQKTHRMASIVGSCWNPIGDLEYLYPNIEHPRAFITDVLRGDYTDPNKRQFYKNPTGTLLLLVKCLYILYFDSKFVVRKKGI